MYDELVKNVNVIKVSSANGLVSNTEYNYVLKSWKK